jgi:hypothetical protein
MLCGVILVLLCYTVLVWMYNPNARLISFAFALTEFLVVLIYWILGPWKESNSRNKRNMNDYSRISPETDTELDVSQLEDLVRPSQNENNNSNSRASNIDISSSEGIFVITENPIV